MASKTVRAKKGCCGSKPRCRRCPVVLSRLERAGYAERMSRRNYVILTPPKKKAMKAARAR